MTDNKNLELWEKVSRVPPDQLKGFKRSGGFSGTAIKPMWSFHRMTEEYGPCGIGWGVGKPDFTTIQAAEELLVFCTVSVWHKQPSNLVYGVGGDKVRAQFSNGPRNDDEAFKKAYTDAITNALKLIGVGADIHMGLWDGNKYVDDKPEADGPTDLPAIHKPSRNTTSREEYDRLVKALNDCATVTACQKWRADNVTALDGLHQEWKDELWVTYSDKVSDLKKGLAA